jgi:hypothetical protein
MIEIENAKNIEEIVVCDSLCAHGADGIWVDDLLAERARTEVRSLGHVEDLRKWWFADCAAIDRPEATENSEEGGFAAAVGTDDQDVITSFHGERESPD